MLSTNMPQPPILNSDSFPQANPRTLEIITCHLLPKLKRGMQSEASLELGGFVLQESEHMRALLLILEHPQAFEKIHAQQAAWVLHRAFQADQRGLFAHRESLGRALDATDDPSVLREILKILANPVWIDLESEAVRFELLHLALDLVHIPRFPIAVHYAAMGIIQTRIISKQEALNASAAIETLMNNQPEQNPLCRYAAKLLEQLK